MGQCWMLLLRLEDPTGGCDVAVQVGGGFRIGKDGLDAAVNFGPPGLTEQLFMVGQKIPT